MGSPSNRGSLYFTSIRLKNWRNFLDIDVPLQQRVFLVGPNASGKSSFLDAFRFLSDIVTVGGGFQEAVVINRGGISRLRCLSARRVTDIVVQVRIGSADGEPEWEYELHFSQDSRSNPRNDPYGGDFLEAVAQTPIKRRSSHLKRIRNALKVAVPQLAEIELTRDKRGSPHLRRRYEHWRPHGAWQTEDQFSDGTLRLMGMLWSAITGSGPLLLEEPELSLHPEVVRFIPQMFARVQRQLNRQIITSTHSSDLLRDEGIGLDEVLLLQPGENGTSVRPAKDFAEIHQLLNGGLSLAEAVLPMTRPQNAEQLSLFGDL